MDKITYQASGVDPEKAQRILSRFRQSQLKRPNDPRVLSGIGPFASCYSLKDAINGFHDPVLVTSCDGVGTKCLLALEWKNIAGLGQDLVAMSVNDLLCVGAKPLVFLDYYACGILEEKDFLTVVEGVQAACEKTGCSLVGGETAEMPGLYRDGDFDLAGFAAGVVERQQILGPDKVRPRDVLIGLSSSGVHSNGFSLVRRIVEKEKLKPSDKTPFSSSTWAETLLEPTVLYGPILLPFLGRIHAAAHITGGGLYENLPRVLPEGTRAVVSSRNWKFPPLFEWLQSAAKLNVREMLSTFNCGIGMILVVGEADAQSLIQSIQKTGTPCQKIGTIETTQTGAPPEIVWVE